MGHHHGFGGGGSGLGSNVLTAGAGGQYSTPDAAISAATAGQTVLILPGRYTISSGLTAASGVAVRGLSRDQTFLTCYYTSGTPTISLAGANTVSDLTFVSVRPGCPLRTDGPGCTTERCTMIGGSDGLVFRNSISSDLALTNATWDATAKTVAHASLSSYTYVPGDVFVNTTAAATTKLAYLITGKVDSTTIQLESGAALKATNSSTVGGTIPFRRTIVRDCLFRDNDFDCITNDYTTSSGAYAVPSQNVLVERCGFFVESHNQSFAGAINAFGGTWDVRDCYMLCTRTSTSFAPSFIVVGNASATGSTVRSSNNKAYFSVSTSGKTAMIKFQHADSKYASDVYSVNDYMECTNGGAGGTYSVNCDTTGVTIAAASLGSLTQIGGNLHKFSQYQLGGGGQTTYTQTHPWV